MIVLIDRKFNEEQLLLETFFSKNAYSARYLQKSNLKGVKTPLKKAPGLICCLGHHSRTFSALVLLPAHFAIFFPHLPRA